MLNFAAFFLGGILLIYCNTGSRGRPDVGSGSLATKENQREEKNQTSI